MKRNRNKKRKTGNRRRPTNKTGQFYGSDENFFTAARVQLTDEIVDMLHTIYGMPLDDLRNFQKEGCMYCPSRVSIVHPPEVVMF